MARPTKKWLFFFLFAQIDLDLEEGWYDKQKKIDDSIASMLMCLSKIIPFMILKLNMN
jgi:hypothetical protein